MTHETGQLAQKTPKKKTYMSTRLAYSVNFPPDLPWARAGRLDLLLSDQIGALLVKLRGMYMQMRMC